jgi:hypothetical protein
MAAAHAAHEAEEARRLQTERDAVTSQLHKLQMEMKQREEELTRAKLSLARQMEARREAQQRARRAAAQSGGRAAHESSRPPAAAAGSGGSAVSIAGANEEEDAFYDCEEALTEEERRLMAAVSPRAVCGLLQRAALTVAGIEQGLLEPLDLDKAARARARGLLRSVLCELESSDRVMPQLDEEHGLLFHLKT